jgi:hypothetical protein
MTAPLATAGPLLLPSYPQAVHMVDSFLWKATPKTSEIRGKAG